MRTFSLEEVLGILIDMDKAINPEAYEESKNLSTKDFKDSTISLAQNLGIEKEYLERRKVENYLNGRKEHINKTIIELGKEYPISWESEPYEDDHDMFLDGTVSVEDIEFNVQIGVPIILFKDDSSLPLLSRDSTVVFKLIDDEINFCPVEWIKNEEWNWIGGEFNKLDENKIEVSDE